MSLARMHWKMQKEVLRNWDLISKLGISSLNLSRGIFLFILFSFYCHSAKKAHNSETSVKKIHNGELSTSGQNSRGVVQDNEGREGGLVKCPRYLMSPIN